MSRPGRRVLALLAALATLPPFVAQGLGEVVGSDAMFARLSRHRLRITAETGRDERPVTVRELSPHLSRDARRFLLPLDGWAASAGQAEIVEGGLVDLGRIVCALRPEATAARVVLERGPLEDPQVSRAAPGSDAESLRRMRVHAAEAAITERVARVDCRESAAGDARR